MNIQSLSIVVPNNTCINKCPFCVSRMHNNEYEDFISKRNLYFDLYFDQYMKKMEFARDNGCNTVMLTGDSEPQQNYQFLMLFGIMNKFLPSPFKQIELQTTGVLLDDAFLYFLRHHVKVNTISLSLSSLYSPENATICGMPKGKEVGIEHLCERIKQYRFTLRLSLNLNDAFNNPEKPADFFNWAKSLKADQLTFRVLYESGKNTPQDQWIKQHAFDASKVKAISDYIRTTGTPLEQLEFGQTRYSVNGISTVLDDDCMSTETKKDIKYLILRPDCNLYTKWDDPGSKL